MFPTSSYVACLVPSWWCYLGRCWKLWKGGGPSPRVGQWRDCIGDLFPFLCFLSVTRWEPPLPHTWAAVTSGLDSCSQTSRVWSESKHVFPCAWLLMLNILSLQCKEMNTWAMGCLNSLYAHWTPPHYSLYLSNAILCHLTVCVGVRFLSSNRAHHRVGSDSEGEGSYLNCLDFWVLGGIWTVMESWIEHLTAGIADIKYQPDLWSSLF